MATELSATAATPRKSAGWPNFSTAKPEIGVLSEAPIPERVPMTP